MQGPPQKLFLGSDPDIFTLTLSMLSLVGLLALAPTLALDAIIPITVSDDGSGNGVAVVQDTVTAVFTAPTVYVTGNNTYTILSPTTLLITDCPCTVSSTFMGGMTGMQTAMDTPPPASTGTSSLNTSSTEARHPKTHTVSTNTKDSITAVSTNGAPRLSIWPW